MIHEKRSADPVTLYIRMVGSMQRKECAMRALGYLRHERAICLCTRTKSGTAASSAMTQKAMTADTEWSYRIPITALPANQNSPYAPVNKP